MVVGRPSSLQWKWRPTTTLRDGKIFYDMASKPCFWSFCSSRGVKVPTSLIGNKHSWKKQDHLEYVYYKYVNYDVSKACGCRWVIQYGDYLTLVLFSLKSRRYSFFGKYLLMPMPPASCKSSDFPNHTSSCQ